MVCNLLSVTRGAQQGQGQALEVGWEVGVGSQLPESRAAGV